MHKGALQICWRISRLWCYAGLTPLHLNGHVTPCPLCLDGPCSCGSSWSPCAPTQEARIFILPGKRPHFQPPPTPKVPFKSCVECFVVYSVKYRSKPELTLYWPCFTPMYACGKYIYIYMATVTPRLSKDTPGPLLMTAQCRFQEKLHSSSFLFLVLYVRSSGLTRGKRSHINVPWLTASRSLWSRLLWAPLQLCYLHIALGGGHISFLLSKYRIPTNCTIEDFGEVKIAFRENTFICR